ncbi:MAG: mechanosensitive ion channel protein MscS [Nitrosomonadaceae bacterium]|nr:MAG: mechanosensitive ion channel protein MscS [Nitrosomonadaceae bacterium]
MQPNNEFQSLLSNLITDLQEISALWQFAVLLASLGVAWLLQRQLAGRVTSQVGADRAPIISASNLSRLMFPLFALVLVVLGRWALQHWHPTHLLNIAIPLLFALALIRIAIYILRRVFHDQQWLHPWERTIGWTIWTVLALHIIGVLPEILGMLDAVAFHVGQQRLSVLLILQGIVAFTVSMLLALWLASSLESRVMSIAALDMNQRVMLSKVARTMLILLSVLITLPLIGVDVTVLSVFGGALGVGLGLGLQKIASNYVSGFIILLDHSLRLGDVVTVDNRTGKVVDLTNRYVVLHGLDGVESIVPNDTFITSTVVKQTHTNNRVRLALTVQISYDSPLEAAMRIMQEAARKQPRVLTEPEPMVFLKEFADNGINLELGFWISDPEEGQIGLRSAINMEIWREFQNNSIEIPFPQREVRLIGKAI